MNQDEKRILQENTRRLLVNTNTSSDKLFAKSVYLLIPSRRRIIFLIVSTIIIFLATFYLCLNSDLKLIKSFTDLVADINQIVIPTFAVIITGYAIFQALANGTTLINLITIDTQQKSKFEEYNLFFLAISLLYLFLTIFNLLMLLIFKNINENWSLKFIFNDANVCIASLLLTVYLVFVLNALIEIKSFIYNLYQCFNINAASSAIQFLKDNEDS